MSIAPPSIHSLRESLGRAPVIGVVRTESRSEAARQARLMLACGLELVEITFTVPGASDLVAELLEERGSGPPWIGMGTVTDADRARRALAAGAEFLISPNVEPEVARVASEAGAFLALGALTCTEIVAAHRLGADLVKVYPLPPVGGPSYLSVVRGPLPDVPVLAAGGFGVEEIPGYRAAGAIAFGIGGPLLLVADGDGGWDEAASRRRIERALALGRGESGEAGAESEPVPAGQVGR